MASCEKLVVSYTVTTMRSRSYSVFFCCSHRFLSSSPAAATFSSLIIFRTVTTRLNILVDPVLSIQHRTHRHSINSIPRRDPSPTWLQAPFTMTGADSQPINLLLNNGIQVAVCAAYCSHQLLQLRTPWRGTVCWQLAWVEETQKVLLALFRSYNESPHPFFWKMSVTWSLF